MLPDSDAQLVFDPPGPRRFGTGSAWVVGLPLSPSGIGADRSTSLRGFSEQPDSGYSWWQSLCNGSSPIIPEGILKG